MSSLFIGHYALGQRLPLRLWIQDQYGQGVWPDAVPLAVIYGPDGDPVAAYPLPASDQNEVTGWFEYAVSLDSRFQTGRHTTLYTFLYDGSPCGRSEEWELVPGGDGAGSGMGLFFYRQPQADFLLLQTDRGLLRARRNPRVE